MKIFKYALFSIPFLYFSCSDDDDNTPEPINEEEVITTMTVTLTDAMGNVVTMQTQDLDGDGPNEPVVSGGTLSAGTTYTGSIVWLNEMEDPAEDVTLEIVEEQDEHQVFFSAMDLAVDFAYVDFDSNGFPVGTQFTLTTTNAGSGTVTITLIHEPMKPNDGTVDTAGGSIDIQTSFPVTVE